MICQRNEVGILANHLGSDHIYLLVSVTPYLSANKVNAIYKRKYINKITMERCLFAKGKGFWKTTLHVPEAVVRPLTV